MAYNMAEVHIMLINIECFCLTANRVSDITFWKEELVKEIHLMEREISNLEVGHLVFYHSRFWEYST